MLGAGVTAYSRRPRFINADLADDIAPVERSVAERLLPSPGKGASTSVYLATQPRIERYTGGYCS